ncbi:MAG TPA: MarR family transcriptional regulator [Thermomicrobiales bacterium]|nr:MarR family transcriptional regulator [Thermomicrobiales bacterium]
MTEGIVVRDEEIIQRSMGLVPEIARRMHATFIGHPLAAGRPIGQAKLMGLLYRVGRCTVGEAAVGLGVTMPTASEQIDRLVEEGLLVREVNPADRRQVLVDLTPKAREFGRELHELRLRQLRAALDRLEPDDRPVFLRSLEALVDALRLAPDELPPAPAGFEQPDACPAASSPPRQGTA